MNIDGIRNAFSKGGISIATNGIIVAYTYRERWVSQEMTDENREVFLELLQASDQILIERMPGRVIKFVFHNDFDCCNEMVFYPPMAEEISLRDLECIFENSWSDEAEERVCNFFYGIDLDDDDAVLKRLGEYFDLVRGEHETNIVDMQSAVRWMTVRDFAVGFSNILGLQYEIIDPDFESNGSVTVFFHDQLRNKMVISGKSKELLEKAIVAGIEIEIECNINDGFLNLTFYA